MWQSDWFWITSLCNPNRIFGSKGFHPTTSQRAALARRFHFPSLSLTRMLITALKLGVKMPTPVPPRTTVPTLGSGLRNGHLQMEDTTESWGYQPEIMGIHGGLSHFEISIQSDRQNDTLWFPFGGLNLCVNTKKQSNITGNHVFYHQTLGFSVFFFPSSPSFKKPKRRGSHAADHALLSHTRKNPPPSSEVRGYRHRSHSNAWKATGCDKHVGKHRWLLWMLICQKIDSPTPHAKPGSSGASACPKSLMIKHHPFCSKKTSTNRLYRWYGDMAMSQNPCTSGTLEWMGNGWLQGFPQIWMIGFDPSPYIDKINRSKLMYPDKMKVQSPDADKKKYGPKTLVVYWTCPFQMPIWARLIVWRSLYLANPMRLPIKSSFTIVHSPFSDGKVTIFHDSWWFNPNFWCSSPHCWGGSSCSVPIPGRSPFPSPDDTRTHGGPADQSQMPGGAS